MVKMGTKTAAAVEAPPKIKSNFAVDLGNGYVNYAGDHGAGDFRAILAPLSGVNRLKALKEDADSVFLYNGVKYALGEKCYELDPDRIEENVSETRYQTRWYKTLFAAALHRQYQDLAGSAAIIQPNLMSSIPAKLFKEPAIAQLVKDNLVGHYEICTEHGECIVVEIEPARCKIVPEGMGTHWSHIFGPTNEHASVYAKGLWVYLDFGYLSLDMNCVYNGQFLAQDADSDTHVGMSLVADAVRSYVLRTTGTVMHRAEIDEMMANDSIEINREPITISAVRDAALADIGSRASTFIHAAISGRNISGGIVVCGGGAQYVLPYIDLKRLPKLVVADNHRRSNVDGAYLYMTHATGK